MGDILFYAIIFVFGLIVGSFLNCVIYRLYARDSFLRGRSYCPKCKHKLAWYDLIPLVSFIILRGRCRYCGERISFQYPAVELATGVLFLLVYQYQFVNYYNYSGFLLFGLVELLYYLIVASFLIIIFVYDLRHYIIPDRVIYTAIGIVFLYQLFDAWSLELISGSRYLLNLSLSGLFAALFFLAIVVISRGRWMGLGDVKLAFLMGVLLGYPNILIALFTSFFIGAIIGLGLVILKKKGLRSEIPFGPFLVTGTFIAIFWGQTITNWYLSLIF